MRSAKTVLVYQKATKNASKSQTVAPGLRIASLIRAAVMADAAILMKPVLQRVSTTPTAIPSLHLVLRQQFR
jgi:hypothetical protein